MNTVQISKIVSFIEQQERFNRELAAAITSKAGADELFENRLEALESRLDEHSALLKRLIEQVEEGGSLNG